MENPNPVAVLEQRVMFLASIVEVAQLCNWSLKDIHGLKNHVHDQLIAIDNLRYDLIFWGEEEEEEADQYSEEKANFMWHAMMEQLRKDLSLILGVKIKYI
jgi:hypothetical protein